jgi:hypothetical protein
MKDKYYILSVLSTPPPVYADSTNSWKINDLT